MIAGFALAMLFSGAVTGLHSTQFANHYVEAVAWARSHLAVAGTVAPPAAGVQSGEGGGGYRWRVSIAPIGSVPLAQDQLPNGQEDAAGTAPALREMLFDLAVVIYWTMDGGERQVRLDTERLGPAPRPMPTMSRPRRPVFRPRAPPTWRRRA